MRNYLTVAAALVMLACGSPGVGTFVYNYTDPPPDMTKVYRLSVDSMGNIHDSMLGGQECKWMLNRGCEKRCFPVEPMWQACDFDNNKYHYTRQGLTTIFEFGRITQIQDPQCHGEWTYSLVKLENLTNDAKFVLNQRKITDCTSLGGDLRASLYDRTWYRTSQVDFLPASEADLPPKPAQ